MNHLTKVKLKLSKSNKTCNFLPSIWAPNGIDSLTIPALPSVTYPDSLLGQIHCAPWWMSMGPTSLISYCFNWKSGFTLRASCNGPLGPLCRDCKTTMWYLVSDSLYKPFSPAFSMLLQQLSHERCQFQLQVDISCIDFYVVMFREIYILLVWCFKVHNFLLPSTIVHYT